MYVIQCTVERRLPDNSFPISRVGEYLAFRDVTQETWAENPDFAKRFATQAEAQAAVLFPAHEAAVPLP